MSYENIDLKHADVLLERETREQALADIAARVAEHGGADEIALIEVDGRGRAVGLTEAVERRRQDPEFKARLRRIIEEDRELLERLAR